MFNFMGVCEIIFPVIQTEFSKILKYFFPHCNNSWP